MRFRSHLCLKITYVDLCGHTQRTLQRQPLVEDLLPNCIFHLIALHLLKTILRRGMCIINCYAYLQVGLGPYLYFGIGH